MNHLFMIFKRLFFSLAFLSAYFISPVFAQTQETTQTQHSDSSRLKTILLKDGTSLKGKLIRMEDGVYSFETTSLGRVNIHEENIASISDQGVTTAGVSSQGQTVNSAEFKEQSQSLQKQLMSDPEIMSDIQAMASDPELMQILSDQDLVKAALSNDVESIKNNPNTMKLLENEKFKSLIQKIGQKTGQSGLPSPSQ